MSRMGEDERAQVRGPLEIFRALVPVVYCDAL